MVMVFTQDLKVQTKGRGWDVFSVTEQVPNEHLLFCWGVSAPDSWLMDMQGVPWSMQLGFLRRDRGKNGFT